MELIAIMPIMLYNKFSRIRGKLSLKPQDNHGAGMPLANALSSRRKYIKN